MKNALSLHRALEPELLVECPHYVLYAVGPHVGGECYLFHFPNGESLLIDTGFAYCAQKLLANIQAVLGKHELDWLFLTHTHYDHASAAGWLHEQIPSMKIAAGAYAARVFSRPGALATMRSLNESQALSCGYADFTDVVEDVPLDRILGEGDVLSLGGLDFTCLELPGHTKCSVGLWCGEIGLLIGTESIGVRDGVPLETLPEHLREVPPSVKYLSYMASLVSFKQCENALERCIALNPKALLLSHRGYIEGDDLVDFFNSVSYWKDIQRAMVVDGHNAQKSDEDLIAEFKSIFYPFDGTTLQPEDAFDLNASYIIPTIIREFCEGEN